MPWTPLQLLPDLSRMSCHTGNVSYAENSTALKTHCVQLLFDTHVVLPFAQHRTPPLCSTMMPSPLLIYLFISL